MTTIKQFNYEVRDSQGEIIRSDSKLISLRINDSTPKYLIHKSIVIQSRNNRQGTASCKTRSDVRGGGVTFGPKPRSYEKKLNIKEKRLALSTALYYSMSKVTVIDNIFNSITVPKTKSVLALLSKFIPESPYKKSLVITHESNPNLTLSIRNLPNVQLLYSSTLNIRDLLSAKHVVITEEALKHLTETI